MTYKVDKIAGYAAALDYEHLKARLMSDLIVNIPNSNNFGQLIHSIHKRTTPLQAMNTTFNELSVSVVQDAITTEIARMFDVQFEGKTIFNCPVISAPENYQIGLIVGPSGSGKSSILKTIGPNAVTAWDDDKAVASHFASAAEAQERLSGVGFNSIPSWLRPYNVLSTGEQFRADMARAIQVGACIDEFTSVVDRNVAKSCAHAVNRLIRARGYQRVTFATCHYDVIEWLSPDWVYDTKGGVMLPRGSVHRPERIVDLTPCDSNCWPQFSPHHYLAANINKSARCWAATWEGQTVGFASALAFPNGYFRNAWREHRTVVLPDFQGLGMGVRISDALGSIFLAEGCKFFSKTAHPRMGEYRNSSPLWRATSKNGRDRQDYNHNRKTKETAYKHLHMVRLTYSHEFTGVCEL